MKKEYKGFQIKILRDKTYVKFSVKRIGDGKTLTSGRAKGNVKETAEAMKDLVDEYLTLSK